MSTRPDVRTSSLSSVPSATPPAPPASTVTTTAEGERRRGRRARALQVTFYIDADQAALLPGDVHAPQRPRGQPHLVGLHRRRLAPGDRTPRTHLQRRPTLARACRPGPCPPAVPSPVKPHAHTVVDDGDFELTLNRLPHP